MRVAAQHLRPEQMVVIAVGDRAKIQPQIEQLGLGPIQFRNAAGELEE